MSQPIYCNTQVLLSGQASGVTGTYVPLSEAESFSIITYGSGVNSSSAIILWSPSPFFSNQVHPFLVLPVTGNGYNTVYSITNPVAKVSASVSGVGNIWAALISRG